MTIDRNMLDYLKILIFYAIQKIKINQVSILFTIASSYFPQLNNSKASTRSPVVLPPVTKPLHPRYG